MEKEAEKLLAEYRLVQLRLNALAKQREMIIQKISEAQDTLRVISAVKADDESLFSLGFGTYTRGKIINDKFLIEIGANVLVEKDREAALKAISQKEVELENALKEVEAEIDLTLEKLEELKKQLGEKYAGTVEEEA